MKLSRSARPLGVSTHGGTPLVVGAGGEGQVVREDSQSKQRPKTQTNWAAIPAVRKMQLHDGDHALKRLTTPCHVEQEGAEIGFKGIWGVCMELSHMCSFVHLSPAPHLYVHPRVHTHLYSSTISRPKE